VAELSQSSGLIYGSLTVSTYYALSPKHGPSFESPYTNHTAVGIIIPNLQVRKLMLIGSKKFSQGYQSN
jgi:hypothetical protein